MDTKPTGVKDSLQQAMDALRVAKEAQTRYASLLDP